MTDFERNTQPVWRRQITTGYGKRERFLVMEFPKPTGFWVWVEERRGEFRYVVSGPKAKPKGPPTFIPDACFKIESSVREVVINRESDSFKQIVVDALCKDQFVSGSAAEAASLHALFWTHFVEDDNGLRYLAKYADEDTISYFVRSRIGKFTEIDGDVNGESFDARYKTFCWSDVVDVLESAVEDTLFDRLTRKLVGGLKSGDKLTTDFCEAVETLRTAATEDDEDNGTLDRQINDLALTFASDVDRSVAAVVALDAPSFLALRALQEIDINHYAPLITGLMEIIVQFDAHEYYDRLGRYDTLQKRNKKISAYLWKNRKLLK